MAEKKATIFKDVKLILEQARSAAIRSVNFSMVVAYWKIGCRIIEEEQKGKLRAGYGEYLINNLAIELSKFFGKGFDERELRKFRQFYIMFPIRDALRPESKKAPVKINLKSKKDIFPVTIRKELSWSHYRMLIRVEKDEARNYYLNEAADNNWSTRVLERQINSFYFERLLSSQNKKGVKKETKKIAGKDEYSILDFVKDPFVLEFIPFNPNATLFEEQLETELLNKLQYFLLELGKGFSFVSRQQRISADGDNFYVDLVFYNYILKCFVLIDLKTAKLTHQDIGQMDFYVRYYEAEKKRKEDNPTIGIILCSEKNETVVKYSVLQENKRLFASKYKLYLPTEKELTAELKHEIELFSNKKK